MGCRFLLRVQNRLMPEFFPTQVDFRKWLKANHASHLELWVGYFKVDSGRESITWAQSVDEALCFGWIDGIRKRIDNQAYMIRFTPRKRTSTWSKVNLARVEVLIAEGRMQPAGLEAYARRRDAKSGIYSYEQVSVKLPTEYLGLLRQNKQAFHYYRSEAPSYIRAANWWVCSAKREQTRRKRLEQLIADCEAGRRIKPMRRDNPGA